MTPSGARAEKPLKVRLGLWNGPVWLEDGEMGSWKGLGFRGQPHGFLRFGKEINETDFLKRRVQNVLTHQVLSNI